MGVAKQSKVTRAARIAKVIAGLEKYFASLAVIALGGKSYKPAELTALLQTDIAADELTSSDRAKLTADAESARTTHGEIDPVLRLVRMFVVAQLGEDPNAADKLAEFGYSPRKRRAPKPATQVQAAAKAKATRVARHTMSAKQKAAIHGTVPAQPGVAPAAEPVVAAPAAPAKPVA